MPPLQPGAVLQHIRQTLEAPGENDQLDQDLLHEFASRRDESAFAALLRRHGQLVLGVGRRVLGNAHDAEDVFQATFLVLARKAGAIRKQSSVGSWLHGVAYRLAMKERARAGRRRQQERQAVDAVPADPAADLSWRELQAVLDEELERLPEKFRAPLLLCYLEGKTQDEAARHLTWSLGTFRRRLDQGRELLHSRLTRRGLVLSAVLLPALLGQSATAAAPIPLLVSTLQAAMAFALGEAAALGAVSAKVVILAEEVMKVMLLTKVKIAAATVFFAAGLAGTGIAVHHYVAVAGNREIPATPSRLTVARLAPLEAETAPKWADRKMVESLLELPNQVPPLQSYNKPEPFRFEDFPHYPLKNLSPYAADGQHTDFVKKAVQVLIDTKEAFADTLPLLPENQQQKNAVIKGIEQRQMNLAEVYAKLDDAYEELKSVERLRAAETPRWRANYDYVTARLLFRMVHFYEFEIALGKVRKGDLPAVDKKIHTGYRLVPKAELSDRGDEITLAGKAKRCLERLAKDHQGTPWEVIAKRELQTKLGLEWKPY